MDTPVRKGKAWLILALLFLFMLINFADKVVVGLAGVPIMHDLGLTPTQFGQLGSAFFLLFSVSAVALGFVVNRVQTRWVIAVLALIWALTQLPMIGNVGFGVLLLSRIALGAGEGPAFPVAIHAAYKWFPDEQRTLPSGILSLGSAVGVFIAAPVLTYLIFQVSWHAAFGLLGGLGLAWVAAWLLLAEEGPLADAPLTGAGPGLRLAYRRLFGSGTVIGTLLCGWVAYWGLALALTWIPTYAAQALHYSPETVGYLTAAQWLVGGLLVFGGGALSQWLKQRGASSRRCRGLLCATCAVLGGACTILMSRWEPGLAQMALQILGFALPSVVFAIGPAMIGEVTPLGQRGALLGVNTAFQTTAGLVAPLLMGWLVDHAADATAGFQQGFLLAGVLASAGGAVGLLLLRPESDVNRLGSAPALAGAASGAGGR
jgi:MFS family permease